MGISFDSLGFDQDWLVVDTELIRRGVVLPACVQQICDPERPVTFVPGHARYRRWEFQLQPGETREDMVLPDRVWQLLSPWITPNDARLVRSVVYRFHATVASAMRAGSVFLAGDSAHQMPPFLGQGLCSGVRDAANLAWKFEMVAAGLAGDALLDTYDEERRPHSTAVVAHAADTGRLIDQLSGRTEASTTIDAAYGGGRPFPSLTGGVLAGTHALVGHQLPQIRIGDELVDAFLGRGFALVTSGGAAVPADLRAAWEAIGARVVVVTNTELSTMFVPDAGVVVVRPDRYVAAVASSADELRVLTATLFTTMALTE
jgi:3-(3-hydroxy-phenyl)propionate hydroxylase